MVDVVCVYVFDYKYAAAERDRYVRTDTYLYGYLVQSSSMLAD